MLGSVVIIISASLGMLGNEANRPLPVQGDTVEVLIAAYRHHFAETQLDSVAVDVETVGEGLSEEVLTEVAAQLALPIARRSEVLWCEEELTFPRRCGLWGLKRLVMFGLSSLEADRAVVWVSSWNEWASGRVDGAGTQYELRRSRTGWSVEKVLLHAAT